MPLTKKKKKEKPIQAGILLAIALNFKLQHIKSQ
jgi:hypothetical protein